MEARRIPREAPTPRREPAPSGWLLFAALLLFTVGVFNIIHGAVALFRSGYFLIRADQLLVFDYTTWGLVLLLIGVVQMVAGLGALSGKTWARVLGITFAILNAIAQIAFLAAFPFWSLIVIAIDIMVIYGFTVPMRTVEVAEY